MDEFQKPTKAPVSSASKTPLRVLGSLVMLVVGTVWLLAGAALFYGFGFQAGLILALSGVAGLTSSWLFATAKSGRLLILGALLAALLLGCTRYAAHMLRL